MLCKICREEKTAEQFYKSDRRRCKECICAAVKANRKAKIEYYRSFDKARASMPHRIAARNEYAHSQRGIVRANLAKTKWTEHNKEKRKIANAVNNAVRDKKLIKPNVCQECGKTNCRIEGHHDDYSKPLDVRWLCSACHRAWHKLNGTVDPK
jgi:hypothetical protein